MLHCSQALPHHFSFSDLPDAEAAQCVKDIDTAKLQLLGYDGSSYLLYEDDGIHKEYENPENYRKLTK